jgi:hypothetical protein
MILSLRIKVLSFLSSRTEHLLSPVQQDNAMMMGQRFTLGLAWGLLAE